MSTLTEVERMLLRAAVDADESGEGYNDTSNLFATVEMIVVSRVARALRSLADAGELAVGDEADSGIAWAIARRTADRVEQSTPPPPPPMQPPLPSPVIPDVAGPGFRVVPGGILGTMTNPFVHQHQCPCRPENGGSGICGCIHGGPPVSS